VFSPYAGSTLDTHKTPRAFLSHSTGDKPIVYRVASYLSAAGIRCWVDEAEILPGESLIRKISDGVFDCDFVLAFLSPKSCSSEWVNKELSLAMHREINDRRVVVIPIVVDPCPIPRFLIDKLYINIGPGFEFNAQLEKLADGIRRLAGANTPLQTHPNSDELVGATFKNGYVEFFLKEILWQVGVILLVGLLLMAIGMFIFAERQTPIPSRLRHEVFLTCFSGFAAAASFSLGLMTIYVEVKKGNSQIVQAISQRKDFHLFLNPFSASGRKLASHMERKARQGLYLLNGSGLLLTLAFTVLSVLTLSRLFLSLMRLH